jgi:hypothetical protein
MLRITAHREEEARQSSKLKNLVLLTSTGQNSEYFSFQNTTDHVVSSRLTHENITNRTYKLLMTKRRVRKELVVSASDWTIIIRAGILYGCDNFHRHSNRPWYRYCLDRAGRHSWCKVTRAHFYCAAAGETGPVVVFLFNLGSSQPVWTSLASTLARGNLKTLTFSLWILRRQPMYHQSTLPLSMRPWWKVSFTWMFTWSRIPMVKFDTKLP